MQAATSAVMAEASQKRKNRAQAGASSERSADTDAPLPKDKNARAKELQQKRGRNLRSIYFDAYIKEWTRFVNRIRIVSPTNLDRAKDVYGEVMRGRPNQPLKKVFLKLQENVTLKDDFDYGEGINLNPFEAKKTGSQSSNRAGDVARTFAPRARASSSASSKPSGSDAMGFPSAS